MDVRIDESRHYKRCPIRDWSRYNAGYFPVCDAHLSVINPLACNVDYMTSNFHILQKSTFLCRLVNLAPFVPGKLLHIHDNVPFVDNLISQDGLDYVLHSEETLK